MATDTGPILVLACCASVIAACSTVRLTPSALRYRSDGGAERAQDDLEDLSAEIRAARFQVVRVIAALREVPELAVKVSSAMGAPDAAESETDPIPRLRAAVGDTRAVPPDLAEGSKAYRDHYAPLAQRVVDLWWSGALGSEHDDLLRGIVGGDRPVDGTLKNSPRIGSEESIEFLEAQRDERQSDVRQLLAIERGEYEYFVDGSVFFSIEPLIAVRPGLEATAIPSLGVNWRPFDMNNNFLWIGPKIGGLSATALQVTFGGALNPSGSDSTASSGALGAGFSLPIATYGALSVGCVWFNDNGDPSAAPYVSLTLGDFGKAATPGPAAPR